MFPTSSDFHDLRMTQSEMYARKLYLESLKETNYKKKIHIVFTLGFSTQGPFQQRWFSKQEFSTSEANFLILFLMHTNSLLVSFL